jgi:hypothetical protein
MSAAAKTRVVMIDNYDSFTYNIVQYLGELGAEVEVYRNDEIGVEDIAARRPDRLVVSPGTVLAGRGRHLGGRRSGISWASCRSWVCAWGTRASALHWGAPSCVRRN